jgi:hypothetical protein
MDGVIACPARTSSAASAAVAPAAVRTTRVTKRRRSAEKRAEHEPCGDSDRADGDH